MNPTWEGRASGQNHLIRVRSRERAPRRSDTTTVPLSRWRNRLRATGVVYVWRIQGGREKHDGVGEFIRDQGRTSKAVRYRTPDRRQIDKRGFATKRDARAFAATIEVRKRSGEFESASAGRVTVGELAPAWLDKNRDTPPHRLTSGRSIPLGVHTFCSLGRARLVPDVATIDVEAWITGMAIRGYGSTTVRRVHAALSGIPADAVKSRLLVTNPAASVVNLPRRVHRRHIYLTGADVQSLATRGQANTVC